jgi:hypothetical protein
MIASFCATESRTTERPLLIAAVEGLAAFNMSPAPNTSETSNFLYMPFTPIARAFSIRSDERAMNGTDTNVNGRDEIFSNTVSEADSRTPL